MIIVDMYLREGATGIYAVRKQRNLNLQGRHDPELRLGFEAFTDDPSSSYICVPIIPPDMCISKAQRA